MAGEFDVEPLSEEELTSLANFANHFSQVDPVRAALIGRSIVELRTSRAALLAELEADHG